VLSTDFDELDGAPVWLRPPGSELPGGFLARERIGLGPLCETWLAWSVQLWCPAILKLPRPHQIEHPRAARALSRESAALCENPHPALPRLYRDGTAADIPHLAVEYIDGPALDEELSANGPLPEPEVALLGAQLLTGLLALHRRGIAQVNLKPGNVILRDLRPVLIDFGSARRIGMPQLSGHPIGTPGYAAPELDTGEPISAGMDLYSLGAVLREARLGRPTYAGPAPGALGRTPLAELILTLLHPDPAKRPYSHEALTTFAAAIPEDLRPWPAWVDPLAPGAGSSRHFESPISRS
jgi:serine/threonine protein kinase